MCVYVCWDTSSIDIICILKVLLEGFSVNWLSSRQFTLASFHVGDRCRFSNIYVCSLKYYYVWYSSYGASLFAQNSMCARLSFKNPIQYRCTYRSSVILVSVLYLKAPSSRRQNSSSLHKKSQVGQDWAHLLYLVARSTYWQSLWLYLELLLNFEYIEKTHTKRKLLLYLFGLRWYSDSICFEQSWKYTIK